ncbi:MAG: hypothetical protein LBF88_03245 [Planctomycetaceae bacterium]|jgi:hypothetical protein|nr:hypothetical protein [Planctomycetaceae bacterium]
MSTNNIPDSTGLTFEKVWHTIQKNAKLMRMGYKRSQKEYEKLREQSEKTDEQIKKTNEQIKKTDEQIKKTDEQIKKTEKQIKRTSKQLGYLNNRLGDMEEYLVAPGMVQQFNKLNYHFSEVTRNYKIYGKDKKTLAEIDMMLENDDFILCVEVKVTPTEKDILQHIERLKIVQQYFRDRRPKEKKVIGAIAGTVFKDEFKNIAIENGLYVIAPSGHTFKIDVPEGFEPQIFSGDSK